MWLANEQKSNEYYWRHESTENQEEEVNEEEIDDYEGSQ
jgi:hypothetical protein